MKNFYFTGTVNSLYIAKRLGGELYSIPQVLKGENTTFEDEKIGIIFPIYGFSMPAIVMEFIEKFTLKSPYIFVIMTCGSSSGDATKYFTSFAKKHNIEVNYSNSIAMIGNHIPLVNIDEQKSLDKNIEVSINKLIKDISNKKNYIHGGSPIGPVIRNVIKVVKKIKAMDSPDNFYVNENCIKCNICIKVCLRANVFYSESKHIIFGKQCESCLSCVNNCPKKAIQVKGDKNPNARFRNDYISLKEIIDSNQQ
ncbi:EFR1 family ferrodoxin (plasmid) [Paraclostridium sordellii]|uniref:EFR1 family ferrodoxin n=1 Tax=Paraclostridium sordellii TaxID=1505 RepID=UPI0005E50D1F|nr:EFR1 family ferrodoxin [Paeniclostridium sordellii]CEP41123.1 4Fe-4S dicluster domain-containing protein [[Clostridium] sordellii] [Paeniclostridium sordellii]